MKIKSLSDCELISLRTAVETEMRQRGLSFSVGEVGETLAIVHFNSTKGLPNLQAAPAGTRNIDALSRNGERYSIKSRMKAKKTGTIYPDETVNGKQLFEYILLVKMDENYQLNSIHQFSWKRFTELRKWDKRMSVWYLSCSNRTLEQGEKIF